MIAPHSKRAEGRARRQTGIDLALILWPSFLAAGLAGALFFAVVDPQLLRNAGPRLFDNLDRESGYALGFFFFWSIGIFSSAVSVFMIRSARPESSAIDCDDLPR